MKRLTWVLPLSSIVLLTNCTARELRLQPVPSSLGDYQAAVERKASLGDDYELHLCGNYTIIRTNPHEVAITRPHGHSNPVIAGNVQRLAVKMPYVTGFTSILRGDENPTAKDKAGYFVLDTATEQMKLGLTEQQWRSELEHIGWQNPRLSNPI